MGASLHVLLCFLFTLNSHFVATVWGKSKVHIVYLGSRKHDDPNLVTESHHEMLTSVLGSKEAASESIIYSYKHGFSGFAAKLTDSQVEQIEDLPGVVHVIPNQIYSLKTTRSWDYLGQSMASGNSLVRRTDGGRGVIVGVIDSGVWPESRAYNDREFNLGPISWRGRCVPGQQFDPSRHCNRKLIGAKWFIDAILAEHGLPQNFDISQYGDYRSARDADGHGTHTSSTAAGSIDNVNYNGGLITGAARGGAPNAYVAIYKVGWKRLGASSADILKAFDEAINDGVNLLSVSLGPPSIPLYSQVDTRDVMAVGSFHAVARGIPVIAPASNEGPYSMTVLNTAPWLVTVAATTIDRSYPTQITLGNNVIIMGQSFFLGRQTPFHPLISAEEIDLRSNQRRPNPVAQRVVLFFDVVTNSNDLAKILAAPGVVGIIHAKNPSDNIPTTGDVPYAAVNYELGSLILSYIHTTRSPTVRISPSRSLVNRQVISKVAHYSCRGPNSLAPAILKPDIAAPGSNILAASIPSDGANGYAVKSGTSMATPHVAGIVALLKVLHPTWSPAALKSAMVTTATKTDPHGEPIITEGSPKKLADPFDYGGGLVNPDRAADPGLLYDMNTNDYVRYLCSMGYNESSISAVTQQTTRCANPRPSILDVNVPAITIPNLREPVTLTRTVRNVGPVISTYRASIEQPLGVTVRVNPDVLVFDARTRIRSFQVTVTTTHTANTWYFFGSLTWTDGTRNVVIPISVRTQIVRNSIDEY